MPSSCVVCDHAMSRNKPGVNGLSCSNPAHYSCVGIIYSEVTKSSASRSVKWQCADCDRQPAGPRNLAILTIGNGIEGTLNKIFSQLSAIKKQQSECNTSLNYYSEKIDDFEKKLKVIDSLDNKMNLNTEMDSLKTDNFMLKN
ncbi:hypothetical protein HHI36_003363 [Cryptolaemus montrouzieri]|uniref:PHD-type domain-containing protein n=1 Tax=Cryptolaemus montrouzieri TaxID=559131 RepID=A0ABD2PD71_9CUCU